MPTKTTTTDRQTFFVKTIHVCCDCNTSPLICENKKKYNRLIFIINSNFILPNFLKCLLVIRWVAYVQMIMNKLRSGFVLYARALHKFHITIGKWIIYESIPYIALHVLSIRIILSLFGIKIIPIYCPIDCYYKFH